MSCSPPHGIIAFVMNDMASVMGVNDEVSKVLLLGRNKMTKFYESVWVPFVVTKKKILILAIASFIALC